MSAEESLSDGCFVPPDYKGHVHIEAALNLASVNLEEAPDSNRGSFIVSGPRCHERRTGSCARDEDVTERISHPTHEAVLGLQQVPHVLKDTARGKLFIICHSRDQAEQVAEYLHGMISKNKKHMWDTRRYIPYLQ